MSNKLESKVISLYLHAFSVSFHSFTHFSFQHMIVALLYGWVFLLLFYFFFIKLCFFFIHQSATYSRMRWKCESFQYSLHVTWALLSRTDSEFCTPVVGLQYTRKRANLFFYLFTPYCIPTIHYDRVTRTLSKKISLSLSLASLILKVCSDRRVHSSGSVPVSSNKKLLQVLVVQDHGSVCIKKMFILTSTYLPITLATNRLHSFVFSVEINV